MPPPAEVPDLIEKKYGYIDQEEIEKTGEAPTAVIRTLLSFRRKEGYGQRDAGYIKATIYFINRRPCSVSDVEAEIVDNGATYPVRESDRNDSRGAVVFARMVDPASSCRESLLCLQDNFEQGSSYFADMDLHHPYRIIKIEIEDALQFGRIARITTGRSSQAEGHWTSEQWLPVWSHRFGPPTETYPALNALAPNKISLEIPRRKIQLCDTLRFELINNQKDVWFPELLLAAKLDVDRMGPNVTLAKPVEKFHADIIENKPCASSFSAFCRLDILSKVVDCLPADDRMKTLLALSGTNRLIRDIMRHPSLYQTVDLKEFAPINLNEAVLNFIAERASHIRHLRLAWLNHMPQGVGLDQFLNRLPPTLVTLVAEFCPVIDDNIIRLIAKTQPNLETLDLSRCHAISPNAFRCLESLTELRRVSFFETEISEQSMLAILDKCRKIEAINLGSLGNFGRSDKKIDKICAKLAEICGPSSLRALGLHIVHLSNSCLINDVLPRCGRLEELILGQNFACHEWSAETYRLLAASCPRMRRLAINIGRKPGIVKATDIFSFSKHMTRLEYLSLVPTEATPSTLSDLLDNCLQLKHLVVASNGLSTDGAMSLKEEYPRCLIESSEAPHERHPFQDESDDEDDYDVGSDESDDDEDEDEEGGRPDAAFLQALRAQLEGNGAGAGNLGPLEALLAHMRGDPMDEDDEDDDYEDESDDYYDSNEDYEEDDGEEEWETEEEMEAESDAANEGNGNGERSNFDNVD